MSRPTSGPWTWFGSSLWHDPSDTPVLGVATLELSRDVVASGEPAGYSYWAPTEADARLIAAAPDMLAALQQIQRTGYTDVGDRMMVEAAIAKAVQP